MRIGLPISHPLRIYRPFCLALWIQDDPQTEIFTVMVNEVEIAFSPSALSLGLPPVLTGQDMALDTGDKKVY